MEIEPSTEEQKEYEDIEQETDSSLKKDYKLNFAELPVISVNQVKMIEGGVIEQTHIVLKSYNILDCLKVYDALQKRIKKKKDKTIKTKTETNDIAN